METKRSLRERIFILKTILQDSEEQLALAHNKIIKLQLELAATKTKLHREKHGLG